MSTAISSDSGGRPGPTLAWQHARGDQPMAAQGGWQVPRESGEHGTISLTRISALFAAVERPSERKQPSSRQKIRQSRRRTTISDHAHTWAIAKPQVIHRTAINTPSRGVGEDGHAEVDELGTTVGRSPAQAVELGRGSVEADLESFDFAEPAVAWRFVDAFAEVLDDLDETGPLVWIELEDRAADTSFSELGGWASQSL
jgi:hypothetical protein